MPLHICHDGAIDNRGGGGIGNGSRCHPHILVGGYKILPLLLNFFILHEDNQCILEIKVSSFECSFGSLLMTTKRYTMMGIIIAKAIGKRTLSRSAPQKFNGHII